METLVLFLALVLILLFQTLRIMLGAIIGDIVGSIYEFDNIRTKDFPFFQTEMECTDDSILTFATAQWLLKGGDVANFYGDYAVRYPYPMGGYGGMFQQWARNRKIYGKAAPYNSCGNGSAMRVAPVGWAFQTEQEVMQWAETSAACTHNHPEGVKGAQATALAILWARQGVSAADIEKRITQLFAYDLTMSVEELQQRYSWRGIDGQGNGGICQDSVPQAIICALKADDFEDAIRNAVSIGGDSDTIGCITGGIAEALYGIPSALRQKAMNYIPQDFMPTLLEFEEKFGAK